MPGLNLKEGKEGMPQWLDDNWVDTPFSEALYDDDMKLKWYDTGRRCRVCGMAVTILNYNQCYIFARSGTSFSSFAQKHDVIGGISKEEEDRILSVKLRMEQRRNKTIRVLRANVLKPKSEYL